MITPLAFDNSDLLSRLHTLRSFASDAKSLAASSGLNKLDSICLLDIAAALEVEAGRYLERANQ